MYIVHTVSSPSTVDIKHESWEALHIHRYYVAKNLSAYLVQSLLIIFYDIEGLYYQSRESYCENVEMLLSLPSDRSQK